MLFVDNLSLSNKIKLSNNKAKILRLEHENKELKIKIKQLMESDAEQRLNDKTLNESTEKSKVKQNEVVGSERSLTNLTSPDKYAPNIKLSISR